MLGCSRNSNESLKRQLLKSFLSLTIGFMSLVMVMLIVAVVIGNQFVIDSSTDSLYDQIVRHANSVSAENADILVRTLDRAQESVSSPLKYSIGETYRGDYSYGNIPSYFEYGDTFLKPPLTQDSRQLKPVSFDASSYYFPGSVPENISDFTLSQNLTRDLTAHGDTFFKTSYNNNKDFVAEYFGADENCMFRHYPGIGTLDTDPNREYDPCTRPWYTDATSNEGETIYTSPYRDFNGKGWMITLSDTVYNESSSEFIGVIGGDMLIVSINGLLEQITFLDSGKVSLFETNGQVVGDKEWPLDKDDPTIYTYQTLQNPAIPDGTWDKISSVPTGETDVIEYDTGGDTYLAIVTHISDFAGRYLVVVFVKKDEITDPVDPIIADINEKNGTIIGIIVGISVALMVVTTALVWYTTNSIIRPLHSAMKEFNKIGMNLGSSDYTQGLEDIHGGEGDEQREFVDGTNRMIHHLQASRQEQIAASTVDNDLHNNKGGTFLDAIPLGQMFPNNAPPSYEYVQQVPVQQAQPVQYVQQAQPVQYVQQAPPVQQAPGYYSGQYAQVPQGPPY